ncbi:TolC family protein [Odoribacter sp. OttesenSCG-928-L07]|nr:TolC family protein [Odoribacter sp. OttesenSCG-928-L07]MDL2239315.1 TolC family protein [Bacteroidales bacterium OttesenSCG-928-L14]MDL2240360.1 TolC family protein [Bacteroidales bacterium OttesenSCG-928-K22]
MKLLKIFFALTLLLICQCAISQTENKIWTLDDCINYALEQNITIKKSKIAYEESLINTKTAKGALFPSLSFAAGYDYTNTPFGENNNNTFGGNYNLNASWTVFNGTRNKTIQKQEMYDSISELNVYQTQNSITETIIQLYVQILYAAESVKTNESTVNLNKALFERGEGLLQAGSIAKSDLAQLESQYSNSKYQLIVSQNALKNYQLQLKQILELDTDINIDFLSYQENEILVALPTVSEVYQTALKVRPEILASKLTLETSNIDLQIAKAGYYPKISLSAGAGTQHNTSSTGDIGNQLKYAWNNHVGMSISVPILNQRQTKSSVEIAKLNTITNELNLLDEQKALYKTIESLWLDAYGSQEQYRASVENLNAIETSYELIEEQYNVGLKNTSDLLVEKDKLLAAQQNQLQAKYMTILNIKLLNFYQH